MVDLHLVLPALNLSTMSAGILIMVQQVSLMMFLVDYSTSFLLLSTSGLIWVLNWDGLGIGGLGNKGLGPGFDNILIQGH